MPSLALELLGGMLEPNYGRNSDNPLLWVGDTQTSSYGNVMVINSVLG